MKRIIVPIILIVVALLCLVMIYRVVSKAELTVKINEDIDISSIIVRINGEILSPSLDSGYLYTSLLQPGEHSITVTGADVVDYTNSVELEFREKTFIEVPIEKRGATDIAQEAYDLSEAEIGNALFFGDNDWLVFSVSDGSPFSEGAIAIARYNSLSGRWSLVAEGTDFSASTNEIGDAPQELIRYLENI